MLQQEEVLASRGAQALDQSGNKIGTVDDIYLDRETERPEWAVVKTGLLGSRVSFVPLGEASREGNDIRLPYDKATVQGAPSIEANGELSQDEEAELYRYYGLEYSEQRSDTGLPEGSSEGHDVSGPTTDDAMTRSEEELRVGTAERERGRARLKKYVVTEQVQQTVPVQREEIRVEREPITDANVDRATAGSAISEEEHEVVLHEEEAVVEKRAVPKERVRMTKDTVTDEKQVSEEIRKEQIDTEGDVRK